MAGEDLVVLVDEQDHVIGEKPRAELLDSDCCRLAVVRVDDGRGNILMQQRAAHLPMLPNRLTPHEETVKPGESYKDAAIRCLIEELRIGGAKLKFIQHGRFRWTWPYGSREVESFQTTIDWPEERFARNPEEVQSLAWMPLKEVIYAALAGDRRFPPHALIWPKLLGAKMLELV